MTLDSGSGVCASQETGGGRIADTPVPTDGSREDRNGQARARNSEKDRIRARVSALEVRRQARREWHAPRTLTTAWHVDWGGSGCWRS